MKEKGKEERKGGDKKSRKGATREEGAKERGLFREHGAATYLFLCFAEDVQRRVVKLGLHSLLNLVVYVDAAG